MQELSLGNTIMQNHLQWNHPDLLPITVNLHLLIHFYRKASWASIITKLTDVFICKDLHPYTGHYFLKRIEMSPG